MYILDLKQKMEELNIRNDAYSLNGGLPNEAYCIGKRGTLWEVYYSERGNKNSLKRFCTEKKAVEYFIKWVTKEMK